MNQYQWRNWVKPQGGVFPIFFLVHILALIEKNQYGYYYTFLAISIDANMKSEVLWSPLREKCTYLELQQYSLAAAEDKKGSKCLTCYPDLNLNIFIKDRKMIKSLYIGSIKIVLTWLLQSKFCDYPLAIKHYYKHLPHSHNNVDNTN